jgi:long-subunit acyl-CoA synthetase (AMP-forming)
MAATSNAELSAAVAGRTVPGLFAACVAERPGAVALRWKDGDGWAEWTWSEYADRACRVAAGLAALGVGPGDRVVLLMRNRPEFHVADVAALLLGATPISIYNSSAPEQIQYLVGHCRARAAIVEDLEYLGRVTSVRGALPSLEEIVLIDGDPPAGVRTFAELLAAEPVALSEAATVARPEDLVTVIYTSGTTGAPKGVMLDHANVCWTVESLRRAFGDHDPTGSRLVSYLPMAHIAERLVTHYQGIAFGYEVTTCPEAGAVAQYFPSVRPQLVFAVPRVWEKVYAGVQAVLAGDPERETEFRRALEIGAEAAAARARGEALPAELAARFEPVEAAILRPVRELLGLDQVESAISGAAPLPVEILRFFRALGVELSEVYGLSESSGPMTWAPFRVVPGTVGPAIPGCEVVLAEDGEVLCRGGNVFRGYLDDPEKTADALDADGWLHSGDIGEFDQDGYLRIVDRKKELIITAGGKNISPANLEAALKAFPMIGQACVIGEGRPFVSALLVLDPEIAPAWAHRHGVDASTLAELSRSSEVVAEVGRLVSEANQHFAQVEQIKKFTLLPQEWTPDSAEMTPTMKLKRRGISEKYATEIEAMYAR